MDFSWTEEQINFMKAVIEFSQKELNKELIDRDRQGETFGPSRSKPSPLIHFDLETRQKLVECIMFGNSQVDKSELSSNISPTIADFPYISKWETIWLNFVPLYSFLVI